SFISSSDRDSSIAIRKTHEGRRWMMTTEPARPTQRGRIPWGLLGMLIMVATAEVFVTRHGLDFTPVASLDWKFSGLRARQQAPRSEILCFGDSLLKLGV